MTDCVEIFVDGACRGNPGLGGWGAVLRYKGSEKKLYGAAEDTTNNRMELMAAIQAISSLTRPCTIAITTDSQYVKNGITQWIINWRQNNWRTANRKPVKNADLWQQLESVLVPHTVTWHWVKGHSGHPENELADSLANQAIDEWLQSRG